jgi:hypothetical protein
MWSDRQNPVAGKDCRGHLRQSLFSTSADVAHGRELLPVDTIRKLAQVCVRLLGKAAAMDKRARCRSIERWI